MKLDLSTNDENRSLNHFDKHWNGILKLADSVDEMSWIRSLDIEIVNIYCEFYIHFKLSWEQLRLGVKDRDRWRKLVKPYVPQATRRHISNMVI